MTRTILVTGGAGYIGSHICVALLEAGYRVVVVDNLCNSSELALERVAEITGQRCAFHLVDLRDAAALDAVLAGERCDAVIHLAGLKAVGESVVQPLRYYENNVVGTLVLLEALERHGVRTFVFSSSATVYGDPAQVPIREDFPLGPTNPYGRTKLVIEQLLRDQAAAAPGWRVSLLRYFNPVGAHPSGRIGEDPRETPNNLMPYVMQVAVGRQPLVRVFGDDYPTPDGTGVRDYIHVLDLAEGHLSALRALERDAGVTVHNLGTGTGYSVLEVIAAARRATGRAIPYEVAGRRPGDVATCFADPTRARAELGWSASRDLDAMCRDAWTWQRANPDGYR